MSGARGGAGRIVAMGLGLAVALLLLVASEAKAGRYSVAQCGWYVGADADWADSTGGAKFRQDGWCVPAAGQDPFAGVHLKSLTRENQSAVTGTRFARWRWEVPDGTGITRVSGTWWHALHDGFEHRLGVVPWTTGGFDVFSAAASTDVTPRGFVAGFSPPVSAFEARLLCARAESKWCSLDQPSWASLRALTITIEDAYMPSSWIGGDMLDGGWLRGERKLGYTAGDSGAGLSQTEALLDGTPVVRHPHPCAAASIGGEWRATAMRPCPRDRIGYYPIATTAFSDGPHTVGHCATDFSGNTTCLQPRTVLIDNNPPAHPRKLATAGGGGWQRVNDFDAVWANPDQGVASPIAGASWRIEGPAGYDSGVKFAAGRNRAALENLSVPRPGTYALHVWLRDEAGNEAPGSAVDAPLRFDDVPPGIAFGVEPGANPNDELPSSILAEIDDTLSGPASGQIHYRRIDSEQWTELPTKFEAGPEPGTARLHARIPGDLAAGIYAFRAEARDAAGNVAVNTRRVDGTEMVLRRKVAVAPARKPAPPRAKTRLFARLSWRRQSGDAVTVPFGLAAVLNGRLVDADGVGLGGRELRVVSRPSRGAQVRPSVRTVGTGPQGGFRLPLPPGPSRRITVNYRGDATLEPSRRPALALRVRSGILLRATPRRLRTGELVRLRGRVRTLRAPLPRRGKLVAIQYYESAAGRWRPVLVTRSDHSGRFDARYRFRYISGTASIRLRAVGLAEERWPYVPGASRPLVVEVSG